MTARNNDKNVAKTDETRHDWWVSGAIFDADGTILDSMSVWQNLTSEYLESRHLQMKNGLKERMAGASMAEAVTLLKTEYDLPDSEEQILADIYCLIEQDYYQKVQLKPGIYSLIRMFKENGIRLCVATSTDAILIASALRRLNILNDFDFILTSREVGIGKTSPLIYQKALERLQLPKEEVLVFEDAFYAAQTAARDGFRVIGVYDPSESRQQELRKLCAGYTRFYDNLREWDEGHVKIKARTPLYLPYHNSGMQTRPLNH